MPWLVSALIACVDFVAVVVFTALVVTRRLPVLGFICAAMAVVLTLWLVASVVIHLVAGY